MTDTTAHPSDQPDQSQAQRRVQTSSLNPLLWCLLGLFLIGYGVMAFESGTKVSPHLNTTEDQLGKIDYLMAQARDDVSTVGSPESEAMAPLWVRVIERLHSSQYAHGDDSVMTTERHYISMSDSQRSGLSLHMMLGLVLMACGFFQFWPAFRRQYRTAHRVLGVTYILAGFTSMAMSGWHLVSNEISDIFNGYVFYMGLWLMLVIAVTGLTAAGYAIYRRNIAAHLGWQALAFGSFLTAPIQRAWWVGMAPFAGDATFNEMNIVVNVSLFAQAFLAGHLLFCINRNSSALRPALRGHSGIVEAGKWVQVLGLALVLAVLATLFELYIHSPGFAVHAPLAAMVPATAAHWHDAVVVESTLRGALAVALAVQLVLGMRLFLASEPALRARPLTPLVVSAAGLASGAILLSWGYRLGMPRHEISVAGVFYACAGAMQLVFTALFAIQAWRQALGKMREALCLLLFTGMAPAFMAVFLWLLASAEVVPEPYRLTGHGYQMAAAFSLFLPVFIGHLYAMFSAETRRHAVN